MGRLSENFHAAISNFPGCSTLRSHFCSVNAEHSFVDPNAETLPVIEVGLELRTAFSAERKYASRQSLDNELSAVFKYEHIVRDKKHACRFEGYAGIVISQNTVSSQEFLHFLFLENTRGSSIASEMIYFPSVLNVSEKIKYEIQGRVYSSLYNGSHFYTICLKTIGCIPYLVRIVNSKKKKSSQHHRR
ncbi:uncharacterized protein EV154DRAFT_483225 [Mucor mucedo]|uniref:uncharacterized protein n=1 Tax=Mucor mucedo TaxID=29922 RepID=UPI0022200CCD|nr:uncharacterized protein EV154DRAFT_483225 [Mucor mucedo]KAI7889355.1 hypothetical protein EV154DRAFT_483225 [Mucor mucedo]